MYSKSSRGQPTKGDPTDWGLDEGLTTPYRKKKKTSYYMLHRASGLVGPCEKLRVS